METNTLVKRKIKDRLRSMDYQIKLMLLSLITVLFVVTRIVVDIYALIPSTNPWSTSVWLLVTIVMWITNLIALVFTILEYRVSKDKHRALLIVVVGILIFTLLEETVWLVVDIMNETGYDKWSKTFIQDLDFITVFCIACEMVAIPIDIISTYLISKKIK